MLSFFNKTLNRESKTVFNDVLLIVIWSYSSLPNECYQKEHLSNQKMSFLNWMMV